MPHPDPVPPTVSHKEWGGDEAKVKKHPAYGMLQFSRVTTSGDGVQLFGSDIPCPAFIRMTLRRGDVTWTLSNRWYHGNEEIVEVDMSPAQFAEAITAMNIGTGVPCTILFTSKDGRVPGIIDKDTLHEEIKQDLRERASEVIQVAKRLKAEAEAVISESGLGKARQERLRALVSKIHDQLVHGMPFTVKQYHEAVEDVRAQAKAEVDAFIQHVLSQLGVSTLQQLAALAEAAPPQPSLPSHVPDRKPEVSGPDQPA